MVFGHNCSSRQVSSDPAQLHRILLHYNVRNKYVNEYVYMGQFLQGGKNSRLMSFFSTAGALVVITV